jgi:hypothetical protein
MYLFFILWGFVIVLMSACRRIRRLRWVSCQSGTGRRLCHRDQPDRQSDVISPSLILGGLMRVFGGWICVLAIFGLGMQYLTARTPGLDYASEAVLPFYILHQTVLLAVGYFVLQWGLPDVLEWAIVVVISFATIMGFMNNCSGVLTSCVPVRDETLAHKACPGDTAGVTSTVRIYN